MKSRSPYKIVYILGAPHSGSTLVDMAIGSTPYAFSMGELSFYTHAVKKIPHIKIAYANGFICTCGKEVSSCPVWSSVNDRVKVKTPIIKSRGILESTSMLINLINPLEKSLKLPISISHNKQILDAVFRQVKKSQPNVKYLIDSSKDPRRLYELLNDPNTQNSDIIVLHIVRDGKAYVNSYRKEVKKNPDMNAKSMFISALEWMGIQLMSIAILRKYKVKHITIKYNNFALNPQKVLNEIYGLLELEHVTLKDIFKNINNATFHNLQGNPLKKKKVKEIKHDQSWKTELTPFQQIFYTLFFYPFNKFWIFKK